MVPVVPVVATIPSRTIMRTTFVLQVKTTAKVAKAGVAIVVTVAVPVATTTTTVRTVPGMEDRMTINRRMTPLESPNSTP